MLTVVVVLHLLISIGLIVSILLHSGKGTGLSSEITGGLGYQGATVIERYLDRITVGLAIAFLVTTMVLVLFLK
jgi:preprotein translocase subunit SecG